MYAWVEQKRNVCVSPKILAFNHELDFILKILDQCKPQSLELEITNSLFVGF